MKFRPVPFINVRFIAWVIAKHTGNYCKLGKTIRNGQGFPFGQIWRFGQNCMKITESAFLGQNKGGNIGGQANFFGSGGGVSQSPLTRGNLMVAVKLPDIYYI